MGWNAKLIERVSEPADKDANVGAAGGFRDEASSGIVLYDPPVRGDADRVTQSGLDLCRRAMLKAELCRRWFGLAPFWNECPNWDDRPAFGKHGERTWSGWNRNVCRDVGHEVQPALTGSCELVEDRNDPAQLVKRVA
jgi:hypothetical protein